MLAPAKHRFSVKDYYRMAESGVLRPDARVELLDGEIIDMSPIGPFHGGVVGRLTRLFTIHSKDRWLVWPQNPLRLGDHSEPEPDVMLLKPSSDDYTNRHPRPEDVFLLVEVSDAMVEVSDASLTTDLEKKLPAYGRAGVTEVWIVNLDEAVIEIYREPHFNGYGTKTVLHAGDQGHPLAFPDAVVDVAGLLKR
jgi:Uma2 family endonuclease